jgi:hypothetical protein
LCDFSPQLGPQPDFRRLIEERAILRLARVRLHRHRLVADVLHLIDAMSFSERAPGSLVSDKRRHSTHRSPPSPAQKFGQKNL